MKNLLKFILIIIPAILLMCNSSSASTYSVIDQGNNIYAGFTHHLNDFKYGAPIDIYGNYKEDGTPLDHIGAAYDTSQVDVTLENGGITIDIYTNFSGTARLQGLDNEIADFFLDFDLDGIYEFGVDLSYAGGNFSSAGVYSLSSWTTSEDIFGSVNPGTGDPAAYYGGWLADGNDKGDEIIVDFTQTGGNLKKGDVTGLSQQEVAGLYQYSFTLDKDLLALMGADPDGFSFFFGTAECGNDVVMSPVPEPATVLLFASGILVLAAVRRREI